VPPITVVIADHDRRTRAACADLLEPVKGIAVVGKARSAREAVRAVRLKPRILLLDLALSGSRRHALVPVIRRQSPGTKVILLTERASERRILDALAQGAPGYLDKRSVQALLPKAVRVVAAGEAWVPRRMISKIVDRLATLSERAQGAAGAG
jgi:DNA-binding NarL/FixJ family response regulator